MALAAAGPNVLESVAPPSSRELCGTWMLVDRVDRTPDGRVVPERGLGPDPLGILIYDAAGNMSVQIMKRLRDASPAAGTTQSTQAANNSAAADGYDAYFGRYELDTNSRTITHHLDEALAPADVGKQLRRSYAFLRGELHLAFETSNNGVRVRRTLRRRRVA